MALTHANFIATYPEFASVSEGYFALWKAEAALEQFSQVAKQAASQPWL